MVISAGARYLCFSKLDAGSVTLCVILSSLYVLVLETDLDMVLSVVLLLIFYVQHYRGALI